MTSRGSVPLDSRAPRVARQAACQKPSGSTSVWPGAGKDTALGQRLLATPDAAGRLRSELALLHREIGLLSQVRAVPVSLADLPVKPGPN